MKRFRILLPCIIVMSLFVVTGWAYAATFIVDNLGDVDDGNPYTPGDGTNTLRKCIRLANETSGADTINFSVSGTISPTSALPAITDDGTVIDASSQWIGTWPSGQPGITLDGSSAGDVDGFLINTANNCHIRGLFITNFDGLAGVFICCGSQFNTIGGTGVGYRNVISGNGNGVVISDSGTGNNKVCGNYIGTDVTGTADLGNSGSGVNIWGEAHSNIIGGTTEGEKNIISGNGDEEHWGSGVLINGAGTDSNLVIGNYIGTDASGATPLGNDGDGVHIGGGPMYNTVGGRTAGEGNVIAANARDGVYIWQASNNTVIGNLIGTDASGTADLGNNWSGFTAASGASYNRIESNVISGNGDGIEFAHDGTASNTVIGNYIGLDATGTVALGNDYWGVSIWGGSSYNRIGGSNPGEGNVIAFNGGDGVEVKDTDTDYNKITRNSIYDNEGSGINLHNGGNDEIPAPTILSNLLSDSILTVFGTGAGTDATVELFKADSFESGEGMTYLGSLTADENGNFSGKINVRGKGLSVGDPLTATTTHTNDNTSEFCPTLATVGGGWESTYDQMFVREDSLIALPVLRRYRDEILMNDPQGEELVRELYDEHSGELALTLITHPKLARRSSSLVMRHLSGIRRVLDGKQMTINSSQLAKIEILLEDVAAVSSPELKEYIQSIQQILQEGHLANFGIEVKDDLEESTQIVQKPKEAHLFQNKPNPFNPDTWIPYQLSETAEVTIRIYNVSGQLVRTLRLGTKPAGFYLAKNRAAHWDGKDNLGQSVASGVYFYNLEAGKFTATRKMLILK